MSMAAGVYASAGDSGAGPSRRQVRPVLLPLRLRPRITRAVQTRRGRRRAGLADWRHHVVRPAGTLLRPVRQCQVRHSVSETRIPVIAASPYRVL